MSEQLNTEEFIANIKKMLSCDTLEELPHYDAINNFLSACDPVEIERIRTHMIKALFKKRCIDDNQINKEY